MTKGLSAICSIQTNNISSRDFAPRLDDTKFSVNQTHKVAVDGRVYKCARMMILSQSVHCTVM